MVIVEGPSPEFLKYFPTTLRKPADERVALDKLLDTKVAIPGGCAFPPKVF